MPESRKWTLPNEYRRLSQDIDDQDPEARRETLQEPLSFTCTPTAVAPAGRGEENVQVRWIGPREAQLYGTKLKVVRSGFDIH